MNARGVLYSHMKPIVSETEVEVDEDPYSCFDDSDDYDDDEDDDISDFHDVDNLLATATASASSLQSNDATKRGFAPSLSTSTARTNNPLQGSHGVSNHTSSINSNGISSGGGANNTTFAAAKNASTSTSTTPRDKKNCTRDETCGILAYHTKTESALLVDVRNTLAQNQRERHTGPIEDQVLHAIDEFSQHRHWMMHIGPEKGKDILIKEGLDRAVGLFLERTTAHQRDAAHGQKSSSPGKQQTPPLFVGVELGTYCGYSAVLLAKRLRELSQKHGINARLFTVEVDPACYGVAVEIIRLSRIQDIVTAVLLDMDNPYNKFQVYHCNSSNNSNTFSSTHNTCNVGHNENGNASSTSSMFAAASHNGHSHHNTATATATAMAMATATESKTAATLPPSPPISPSYGSTNEDASLALLRRNVLPPGQEQLDFLFLDHDKFLYLPSLLAYQRAGFLRKGTVVVADNVLFAGIMDYVAYVRELQTRGAVHTHTFESRIEYWTEKELLEAGEDTLRDGVEITTFL